MRRKRQTETPEKSAIRKKKDRESRHLRRADSTEKEKMMERISNSQSKLETRLSETQERAEERRASLQSNSKAKRASETAPRHLETGHLETATSRNRDISKPDISKPDISKPDISKPDISKPDISKPDISKPRHFETASTGGGWLKRESNIRQFNSALALASMGVQVEEFRDYGPYTYKIHEQIYLAAGPLHPSTEKALSYGQLYTMDTKQAAEERRSVAPNKNLADQERAGKDLEGIKDFRKLTYIEMPGYAPRLLLLYTKSATSFSDLKTTKDDNGIPTVHDTFVEAAKAQGLLSDDAVVIKSLEEMAAYHMPAQLRAAFSAILA
uniref:Uncharacterized protein n=1 Tax=Caenorhabditis japonica TaxID=281687 RepID=A0A8R1E691_CAEJA